MDFLSWEMLENYANFTTQVYLIVEFTKELKGIKKIPTKYFSFFVSFLFLIIVKISTSSFSFKDLLLYCLFSISLSLSSNGLSNFKKK